MSKLLAAETIQAQLPEKLRGRIEALEVLAEVGSTNSYLLEQRAPAPGGIRIALAEQQTAGRGRMDRRWHSPGSSGICLSMAFTLDSKASALPCLTLAVGIGVAEALTQAGAAGISLKWPNDLISGNGKLGGILTEARPAPDGTVVVTGLGLNYDLRVVLETADISPRIGPASDLASCLADLPSRSAVAAILIDGMFSALEEFATKGFGGFRRRWQEYDWLRGKDVRAELAGRQLAGRCEGIDADGALLLAVDGRMQRITSGSVRLEKSGGQPGAMQTGGAH